MIEPLSSRVLARLAGSPDDRVTCRTVAIALNVSREAVGSAMMALRNRGHAEEVEQGRWQVTAAGMNETRATIPQGSLFR